LWSGGYKYVIQDESKDYGDIVVHLPGKDGQISQLLGVHITGLKANRHWT